MSVSQDEYEPSQIIADNSVSPHLQSFRRSRPSTSNLMQFFEAGGALDSQTTDSQHIQYLIKTREQASGESNEKRFRRCEHLQDNISNLKKELGAARERLKLNDENRSALHNALTRAMTTHREQLHERDQKIETLQTRLQEVIRLGFDIFADEFPGRSSCGSVSPPHGLGLSAMSSKSTSKEELREITEIWLTTNLVDPASTSGSSPLAKHNVLKVDIDPQRRKVAEDTERDTTSEGGEVQIDKKMGQLDDPVVNGFDITALVGEYEPDSYDKPKSGAWLEKDGRWMAYDVKNQDLYAQSGSGENEGGHNRDGIMDRESTPERFTPSKKPRYSTEE